MNRLAHESSPYLLQHAHNPVDWYPWGAEALNRARTESKPLLVSIGYAACHWCHVMERESFENEAVARVMNQHFVCVKVDREERPDVDQVYMEALHSMGVQGGWPLNVFLTAEAKPFYGGTYFAPPHWVQLLENIGTAYAGEHRAELEASAERFTAALGSSELGRYNAGLPGEAEAVNDEEFKLLLYNLGLKFDRTHGGTDRLPKFPMPGLWQFVLRAHVVSGSQIMLEQTLLTLRSMAWGGIYDQAHGGFARYSVDGEWLAPHFEKMLYDNGQLVSLYSEAFQLAPDPLFREVVYDTIEFVRLELTSDEGGFYASLDADSEGEEGRFYTFTHAELRELIGSEEPLFSDYYNCTRAGNWEHGRNILHRRQSDAEFAAAHQLAPGALANMLAAWKQKIMAARATRVRPGLDDKILTGWNALMLQGLCDAYRAFGEPEFLVLARRNAAFLRDHLTRPRHFGAESRLGLRRSYKGGRATIDGFLEDYALTIQAFISLYEISFEEEWLLLADALTQTTQTYFFDPAENLFFFTDADVDDPDGNGAGGQLIARKKELFDNVIPASNSVMAHNLRRLGRHLDHAGYRTLSAAMLAQVKALAVKEPQHLSHWASLYAAQLRPGPEIAIVGPDADEFRQELNRGFLHDTVLAGSETGSSLPLLQHRPPQAGHTTLYVCRNYTCLAPVQSVAEARLLLAQS